MRVIANIPRKQHAGIPQGLAFQVEGSVGYNNFRHKGKMCCKIIPRQWECCF